MRFRRKHPVTPINPLTAEQKWERYEQRKARKAEDSKRICRCGHNKTLHPRFPGYENCADARCDCPAWLEVETPA